MIFFGGGCLYGSDSLLALVGLLFGQCWLNTNTKGIHMVGCVLCGRVIPIPRPLKTAPFAFVFIIKALSLLRCGPSSFPSTLSILIHTSAFYIAPN
ncbi:hypothetical protein VNO77_22069 [Canavalia gladiata]|uniref:Uncharacterized protein n=1 Tax=Canavalia gladiata TaxID=3824 RepID=A0AAN9L1X2_CANGL